jgi:transcriptional regulator with XRE-family HTH domain
MLSLKEKGVPVLRSKMLELVARREIEMGRRIQQKEIAEATGLTPNTISRWMQPKGFRSIDGDVLEALARYFKCRIDDLVYIDYEPEN